MRLFTSLMLMFTVITGFAQPAAQEVKGNLLVDGLKREFLTYIPSADKNVKMPLVISLHGGFASPKGMSPPWLGFQADCR